MTEEMATEANGTAVRTAPRAPSHWVELAERARERLVRLLEAAGCSHAVEMYPIVPYSSETGYVLKDDAWITVGGLWLRFASGTAAGWLYGESGTRRCTHYVGAYRPWQEAQHTLVGALVAAKLEG